MCGIAGSINFSNGKINQRIVDPLINSIKHRGPDHTGYWLSKKNNVLLINTRLSILDLTKRGNQPFISKDKRYIIVFNGEIYNYRNLKSNLEEFFFRSNTDTEVVLNLFIKFGYKCLSMLEGMFAFAIYDTQENQMFCARDQFGVKPFYYHIDKDNFWFSSELKSFFSINKNFKKNEKAIFRYLASEYHEHIKETYYEDIFKIKPGHFVIIKNKKIIEKNYWTFEEQYNKTSLPKNYEDRKSYIKDLVFKSAKKSIISDVPVSLTASGGLDSSILQIAIKKYNPDIKLISWIFQNKEFSEKTYIDEISKITKLKSLMCVVSPKDFTSNIKKSVYINEEPFSGLPIISYYLCLKKLCKNKVILDGSGLDEAHTGYDKYFSTKTNLKTNFSFSQDGLKSVFSNIIDKRYYNRYYNLSPEIPKPFENNLENIKYSDLFHLKLPRALRMRDKISMSLGKELRPCFLDVKLITSLFKLKKSEQFRGRLGKIFLREIFKNDLKRKIVFAKKRNIQTPQSFWFKKDLKKWIDDYFKKTEIWDAGWLNRENFYKNLDLFYKGKINNSFFIWKIINLDIWKNIH